MSSGRFSPSRPAREVFQKHFFTASTFDESGKIGVLGVRSWDGSLHREVGRGFREGRESVGSAYSRQCVVHFDKEFVQNRVPPGRPLRGQFGGGQGNRGTPNTSNHLDHIGDCRIGDGPAQEDILCPRSPPPVATTRSPAWSSSSNSRRARTGASSSPDRSSAARGSWRFLNARATATISRTARYSRSAGARVVRRRSSR